MIPLMVRSQGDPNCKVVIVGECPSDIALHRGEIWNDTAGEELGKMLHEAGMLKSECYLTSVIKQRPPNGDLEEWFNKKTPHKCAQEIRDGISALREEIQAISPN